MEAVADYTGASVNDVWGVATFYTHFRFEPPTKYNVEVCWGPSCHIRGAGQVTDNFVRELGVKGDKSSRPDVTFKRSSCSAACAGGPVVTINEELVGNVKPEQVKDMLDNLDNYGHQH